MDVTYAAIASRAAALARADVREVFAERAVARVMILTVLVQQREADMAIVLDHTIVPAHDNEASARFFARIFGLPYEGAASHFAPVQVNETLVLDFDTRTTFDSQHYAFKVSDGEFDEIFQRVRGEGLAYGSGPFSPDDMTINHRGGGRGFYFKDPNGHLLEVLTV